MGVLGNFFLFTRIFIPDIFPGGHFGPRQRPKGGIEGLERPRLLNSMGW